jgi:hypothetical protein
MDLRISERRAAGRDSGSTEGEEEAGDGDSKRGMTGTKREFELMAERSRP